MVNDPNNEPHSGGPRKFGRGPGFTEREDEAIREAVLTSAQSGTLSHQFLEDLAQRLNVQFHGGMRQRTGPSLWWHIKREQQRENALFSDIRIPGGAPKYLSRPSAPRRREAPATVRPVRSGVLIDVILRDPTTGRTERFTTRKFESFDDLIFALV